MEYEKRTTDYYVVRHKETGCYFRGKGANRWGMFFNQASIYRVLANAEGTARWLNLRGEPVEIVPIKILESPALDVVRCKDCIRWHRWPDGTSGTCPCTEHITGADHFCAYGKRRGI